MTVSRISSPFSSKVNLKVRTKNEFANEGHDKGFRKRSSLVEIRFHYPLTSTPFSDIVLINARPHDTVATQITEYAKLIGFRELES